MDVAASIQAVLDEVVLRLTRSLARQTGARNLCLAGGVALNCVANGKVLRDGHFETSGFSRRRAMPAARSVRRSRPITCSRASRATADGADGMAGAFLGPELSARPRSSRG